MTYVRPRSRSRMDKIEDDTLLGLNVAAAAILFVIFAPILIPAWIIGAVARKIGLR